MKDRLEIIGINQDNTSAWKENDWSKKDYMEELERRKDGQGRR